MDRDDDRDITDDEVRAMAAVRSIGEQFRERELREIDERRADKELRRLPTMRRLGKEFRALERRERREKRRHLGPTGRARKGLLALPAAAIAATVAVILALTGAPAGASSPLKRAPAAAVRAGSVRFHSTITVGLGGRTPQRFEQRGEIDFAHGAYRTTLGIDGTGASQEWRTAAGVLYLAVTEHGPNAHRGVHWIGARLKAPERTRVATVPEHNALTDPVALLNLLAGLDAPTKKLGTATINGVPATEYQILSNLATALQASQPKATISPSARQVDAAINVWLDRSGRPTRIEEDLSQRGLRGRANLREVLDFSGYGSPTSIEVPSGVDVSPVVNGTVIPPLVGTPTRLFESLVSSR